MRKLGILGAGVMVAGIASVAAPAGAVVRIKDADHARQIWTVLVFCVWHAVFVTGTLRPPAPAERGRLTLDS